jgi:thiol-disulfide isomerase/thioredoxin
MRGLVLPALLTLAACSGSVGAASEAPTASTLATPTTTQPPTPEPGASDLPIAPVTNPPVTPAPASPAGVVFDEPWAVTELTDVTTGEVFRITDLTAAGKVVFLEPMAIWCSNCRTQQRDVQAALAMLPADGVVYVVLDVDKNENGDSLAAYRSKNGFQGRYAVAGTDVARALAADFGDQFLNPPSTPVLIIDRHGEAHLLPFGIKSAEELRQALEPFLSEGT